MENLFSDEQIEAMSAQIDSRLAELQSGELSFESTGGALPKGARNLDELFDKEFNQISEKTGQKADEWLKTFAQKAKGELCEKEGMLFKQWDKWSDLTNPATIASFGVIMDKMNIPISIMPVLVVAASVIVLRLGVKTFCELYSE